MISGFLVIPLYSLLDHCVEAAVLRSPLLAPAAAQWHFKGVYILIATSQIQDVIIHVAVPDDLVSGKIPALEQQIQITPAMASSVLVEMQQYLDMVGQGSSRLLLFSIVAVPAVCWLINQQ